MKNPKIGMKGMKLPNLPKPPASIYRHPKSAVPKLEYQDVASGMDMIAEEIAKEFLERLINNIRSNKYGFTIKESTIKRRTTNKSNTPLINEEYLINSLIRIGHIVTVKEGTHPSGVEFLELVMIMEYGRRDMHIPAFPVGRMTFKDFEKDAEKMLLKFLNAKK